MNEDMTWATARMLIKSIRAGTKHSLVGNTSIFFTAESGVEVHWVYIGLLKLASDGPTWRGPITDKAWRRMQAAAIEGRMKKPRV